MSDKDSNSVDSQESSEETTEQTLTAAEPIEASVEQEDELSRLKNEYLYLRAEFDNYRKQAIKERSELLKYAGERLAVDLLETMDVFETALESEVSGENLDDFVKGVQLTAQKLKATLDKHGVAAVECHGEKFDPNLHEAISSEETTEVDPGHISKVFKKPYKYHDKLIRAGQVIVATDK